MMLQHRCLCGRWHVFIQCVGHDQPDHNDIGTDALLAILRSNVAGHVEKTRLGCAIGRIIEIAVQPLARTSEDRSEEHTSELQSLMRISYAVFCLKKKT